MDPAVTGKVIVLAPGANVTLAGTEAFAGLSLVSVTTRPLNGAGAPSVIVINAEFVTTRFKGFGVSKILVALGAIEIA